MLNQSVCIHTLCQIAWHLFSNLSCPYKRDGHYWSMLTVWLKLSAWNAAEMQPLTLVPWGILTSHCASQAMPRHSHLSTDRGWRLALAVTTWQTDWPLCTCFRVSHRSCRLPNNQCKYQLLPLWFKGNGFIHDKFKGLVWESMSRECSKVTRSHDVIQRTFCPFNGINANVGRTIVYFSSLLYLRKS